jgi:hypothetical protein
MFVPFAISNMITNVAFISIARCMTSKACSIDGRLNIFMERKGLRII